MRNDLSARAYDLQTRGFQIVKHLELLEKWGRLGSPILVGSLTFGLMTTTNIDMEVYSNEEPKPSFGFQIISEISDNKGVREIFYVDALETPDMGLYWKIDFQDDAGELWDIDIWLVSSHHPHRGIASELSEAMKKALDIRSRRTILGIKDARGSDDLEFRGIDVYRAVIEDGVSNYGEFRRWMGSRKNTTTLDPWKPHVK